MKIRVLLFSLLSPAIAVSGLHAADEAPAHQHAQGGADDHEHTELGEHMSKMGRAFRALGRQINNAADNQDSLRLVGILRTNAEAGLKLQPEKTADLPADQRTEFVADFRDAMRHFLADVDKLETALKDGQNDQAAELVKVLKKDMEEAHKRFQKKKDRK